VNEKGNKVYYIKAPGNYSLHFKNINVLNNLVRNFILNLKNI